MGNARARPRRAACDCDQIADDVLGDVFARLPGPRDLIRCAATCKRWRRLVTDRAFLRRAGLWPDMARRPSVLVGIFSQNELAACHSIFAPGKPRSPPQFLSLLADDGRLIFDSLVADDGGLLDFAKALASRRGLLLVRIMRPTSVDHIDFYLEKLRLAVCCPLSGKRSTRLLPSLPFDPTGISDNDLAGCALLTDADYGGDVGNLEQRGLTFQVLLIFSKQDGAGSLRAWTYSSATESWSGPIEFHRASGNTRCGPRAGIVTQDTAHWLYSKDKTCFYILSMNTTMAHVSFAKIPTKFHGSMPLPRPPLPCVTGEGRLSFVTIQKHGVLELWTKQEQSSNDHDHGHEHEEGWQHSELADLGRKEINNVFFAEVLCSSIKMVSLLP